MGTKKWHKAIPPVGIERPYLQKAFIFDNLAGRLVGNKLNSIFSLKNREPVFRSRCIPNSIFIPTIDCLVS